jgi:hypothetical protein
VLPLLHGVEEHALDGAADRVEHVGDLLGDLDAEDGVGLREREEALVVVADALGGREEEVDRAERDVDDEDDAADVDAEVDELVEGRLRGAAKVRGREHESRAFEDRAPS